MGKIYIETMEENYNGRKTRTTAGVTSKLREITDFDVEFIEPLKQKINEISDTFCKDLKSDEVELEVALGITAEGSLCILSSSSSLGIKVKMKWTKHQK